MATRPGPATKTAAPGEKKPSRAARTRERILRVSLDLFNTFGEGRVTTGHIADELNISPGNLYYHFRNKEEIILNLFSGFETRIDVAPNVAQEGVINAAASMEDLWLYLHLMFESIWEYRFLYRNLDDLLSRSTKLRFHFDRIIAHKRESVSSLCEALVRGKAMRANEEEIRALTENVLVVATYWLNFQHLRSSPGLRPDLDEQEDLSQGVYQVMALVAPYLLGQARAHLNHLSRNYLK
jgi:AcrR family transcriptional regulator